MSTTADYKSVLEIASRWPAEQRASLAQDLLQLPESNANRHGARRLTSFAKAQGIGRGAGAPPTDEEVRQWIEEHRMNKYDK